MFHEVLNNDLNIEDPDSSGVNRQLNRQLNVVEFVWFGC